MFKKRAEGNSFGRALTWVCTVALLAVLPASAQDPTADTESFALRPQTLTLLQSLQDDWLAWLTAVNEGDRERATEAVDRLLDKSSRVEMPWLPDLSVGAAAMASRLFAESDAERAVWALEAAERLDPTRPESSFLAARIAWADRRLVDATWSALSALTKLVRLPVERAILLNNLALWGLTVLTLTALLFVGLQMATKGFLLYRDLLRFFEKYLPGGIASFLILIAVAWPVVLPGGLLWLALYWSVLLWGYGSRAERAIVVVIWLFLGGLPYLVSEQNERMRALISAPALALDDAASGRLKGGMFTDIGVLQALLGDETAVKHGLADLHRRLGQIDFARALYREVLSAESQNSAVLADLGACYALQGDFETAIDYFRRALVAGGDMPEIHFNLSQAYSELYRFNEAERALSRARGLDAEAVSRWIRHADRPVVAIDGGFDRLGEVRSVLVETWRSGDAARGWDRVWRRALSLPLALVLALVAILLRLATIRAAAAARPRPEQAWLPGAADRARRTLLVGTPEAESGEWGRALLTIGLPVSLICLLAIGRFGYTLPVTLVGGGAWLRLAVLTVLLGFFIRRWRSQAR